MITIRFWYIFLGMLRRGAFANSESRCGGRVRESVLLGGAWCSVSGRGPRCLRRRQVERVRGPSAPLRPFAPPRDCAPPWRRRRKSGPSPKSTGKSSPTSTIPKDMSTTSTTKVKLATCFCHFQLNFNICIFIYDLSRMSVHRLNMINLIVNLTSIYRDALSVLPPKPFRRFRVFGSFPFTLNRSLVNYFDCELSMPVFVRTYGRLGFDLSNVCSWETIN